MSCGYSFGDDKDCACGDAGLPPALIKALHDPYTYSLALRDGTVIEFTGATLSDNHLWLWLDIENTALALNGQTKLNGHNFIFRRGIWVRVSEIAWAADDGWMPVK